MGLVEVMELVWGLDNILGFGSGLVLGFSFKKRVQVSLAMQNPDDTKDVAG